MSITAMQGRRSGKTLQLIKECAKNGGTMVCHNAESKRLINDLADRIGVEVEIISVEELKGGKSR